MNDITVRQLNLTMPIKAVGKTFYGDYVKSAQFIQAVQSELDKHKIAWKRNKVIGVYYDNPNEKNIDELKSFQGVFLEEGHTITSTDLTEIEISGQYVHTKVAGSIEAIYEGYNAIFSYLIANTLMLKSNTGFQISTYENGVATTEIYMELI